jgi:peptidoglycan/LPS O-acetylase OafA/YrhL
LYPVIILGSALGFLELILHGVLAHTVSLSQALLDLASSLALIPTPPLMASHWRIYPVDPPLWSLFFEMSAYIVYAVAAPSLRTGALWMLVGLSGLGLAAVIISMNGGDVGLTHFKLAGFRVAFSFSLGVALHRASGSNPTPQAMPVSARWVLGALAAFLLAPTAPGRAYDLIAVFAFFPTLLLLGIRAGPGGDRLQSVCLFLGQVSYPLYVIHLPLFLCINGFLAEKSGVAVRVLTLTGGMTGVLLLSWLLAKYYDQPVRRQALRGLTRSWAA